MPLSQETLYTEAWSAIIIANVSHLLSVLVLYKLARMLQWPKQDSKGAFISACLHIIAPGGIFLSAPYGESLFSCLNFLGILAYCTSRRAGVNASLRTSNNDACLIAAGLAFACAATVRSNALLNGFIFLYDVVEFVPHLHRRLINFRAVRYLASVALAGLLLAGGFTLPQYLAYKEYCTGDNVKRGVRPWCKRFPPSIYTFVQQHYRLVIVECFSCFEYQKTNDV